MPARVLALLLVAAAVAPASVAAAASSSPTDDGRAVSRFVESVRGKRTLVVAFHPF